MKVLCIGCSWSANYPRYVQGPEVDVQSLSGKGLPSILDALSKVILNQGLSAYKNIIVQLPTPVRSFWESGEEGAGETAKRQNQFVRSGTPDTVLWNHYFEELDRIARLPKTVLFLFNTGGYPFRHPYDFGEGSDALALQYFRARQYPHIYLSLEGRPGFTRTEKRVSKSTRQYYIDHISAELGYKKLVFQHPAGHIIIDAHPNDKADRKAGEAVTRYLADETN